MNQKLHAESARCRLSGVGSMVGVGIKKRHAIARSLAPFYWTAGSPSKASRRNTAVEPYATYLYTKRGGIIRWLLY